MRERFFEAYFERGMTEIKFFFFSDETCCTAFSRSKSANSEEVVKETSRLPELHLRFNFLNVVAESTTPIIVRLETHSQAL